MFERRRRDTLPLRAAPVKTSRQFKNRLERNLGTFPLESCISSPRVYLHKSLYLTTSLIRYMMMNLGHPILLGRKGRGGENNGSSNLPFFPIFAAVSFCFRFSGFFPVLQHSVSMTTRAQGNQVLGRWGVGEGAGVGG